MRYTHWFALGLGGGSGLAGAFALRLAGEGRSTGGLEAAAAEAVSAGDAQQRTEVGDVPAEGWSERERGGGGVHTHNHFNIWKWKRGLNFHF